MQNLLFIALCVGVGFVASHFSKKRGRDPRAWFLIGFLFGLLGLLALFLLPSKKESAQLKRPLPTPAAPLHQALLETVDPLHGDKLWYYLDGNHQQFGPMSLTALSRIWEEGKIDGKSYVWNEEMNNWAYFEQVLKPLTRAT